MSVAAEGNRQGEQTLGPGADVGGGARLKAALISAAHPTDLACTGTLGEAVGFGGWSHDLSRARKRITPR